MTQYSFNGLQGGPRLHDMLLSSLMLLLLAVVIVWSVLANGADIVTGFLDSTGSGPRRR